MIKQKCECGWIGDEDELRRNKVSDPYGTGDVWYTQIEVNCPQCGSDYIDEVYMCETCGERPVEEGYDDCLPCIKLEDYRTDIDIDY